MLTFPVVSAFKEKFPDAHISYLSKDSYIQLLSASKDIDYSHAFNGSVRETRNWISNQKFDIIIDLHKNIRSISVSILNGKRVYRFKKLNVRKKILTSFKIDTLPDLHIVDRYFESLKSLGLNRASKRTPFSIPVIAHVDLKDIFSKVPGRFFCLALGAKFNTKKIASKYLNSFI